MAHLILLFLVLYPTLIIASISLQLLSPAQAEATTTVAWSRGAEDPPLRALAKVKVDENPSLTSEPITIPNPGETSGTVQVSFNRAGIFHLIAYDENKRIIKTSEQFGVLPPSRLAGGNASTSLTLTSPPTTPTPSIRVLPSSSTILNGTTPTSSQSKGASSNTPIIISSVLGGFFFLFFLGLLIYFIRFRRVHRESRAQPTSSPSKKDSGSWVEPFFARPTNFTQPDLEKGDNYPPIGRPISSGFPFKNRSRRYTATTFASFGTEVSSIRFNPLTGRQIELEGRINKLNASLNSLAGDNDDSTDESSAVKAEKLKALIEQLTKLKDSPYALGRTDEVPPGWH